MGPDGHGSWLTAGKNGGQGAPLGTDAALSTAYGGRGGERQAVAGAHQDSLRTRQWRLLGPREVPESLDMDGKRAGLDHKQDGAG